MEASKRDESDHSDEEPQTSGDNNNADEEPQTSDDSDHADEEPYTSDDSDHADEYIDMSLQGTKREFTVSWDEWKLFKSYMLKTRLFSKWMPHLFVRTSTNEIGGGPILQAGYRDEMGIMWKGTSWPATERLDSVTIESLKRGTAFECTNADGHGTITVYNWDRENVDGRYWVRETLGIHENYSSEFFKSNSSIPRCVRQLGMKTFEEAARFFKTDLPSALAYFCRTEWNKLNVKGHISHLFANDLGDPDESVYVAPMARSKLEGVTLIRIDGCDYSLKTGKRVGYELVGEVFEVVAEGGSLERIDDDALVG